MIKLTEDDVRGTQYRPDVNRALLEQIEELDPAQLVREPENSHDPNAIKVVWKDVHLGYVPAEHAGILAALMDAGFYMEACVTDVVPKRGHVEIAISMQPDFRGGR